MQETLYRRPLPAGTIAFASAEGRRIFSEALAAGGLEGYFALAEQFHTQSDPAYCGLGSLVVALNSLGVDPGRLWKGPWRWFAEDLLDCCVPLAKVRERGLNLDEVACLARCNGVDVAMERADAATLENFRAALGGAASGELVMIAAYDRATLGQTGSGHYSPIGGYHVGRDLALLLDVARFKYPPHWVDAEGLWQAMHPTDTETGRSRGWLELRCRARTSSVGFTMRCEADGIEGLSQRLCDVTSAIDGSADLATLAGSLAPLAAHLEVRQAIEPTHRQALEHARASLRRVHAFPEIERVVGAEQSEAVTILILALSDRLTPTQRAWFRSSAEPSASEALEAELTSLRAQLSALWTHANACCERPVQ